METNKENRSKNIHKTDKPNYDNVIGNEDTDVENYTL